MRHNEKSENIARGRRSLVVASQAVGVVAVHRPHRRPNPFVFGKSFHFLLTDAKISKFHRIFEFGTVQRFANLVDLEKC